jgi:hypothetical protein
VAVVADETLPVDLQPSAERPGRRRGRRDRRPGQSNEMGRAQPYPAVAAPSERPAPVMSSDSRSVVRTPIPSLADLLPALSLRPAFLGAGSFGRRWGTRAD